MSVTFTKLFASITESTVWCEPDSTRIVWITMLAMADSKGRVWASIPGLANRARVTVAQVENALATFKAPDQYSRTPDNEGRRVEDIDGGWRLLNHEKYRSIRDEESIKESKRRYINERRKAEKQAENVEQEVLHVENVERCRYNAEAEADTYKSKSTSKDIRAPRFDAQAHLISIGVGESLADDWIKHRRAAKAPPSLTAIDGIAREAEKAGISLADALAMCCQRGWRGFKAEWVSAGVIPLSGLPPNGRRQRTDELRETASIILTGRTNDRQPTERDITAECHRVA